MKYINLKKWFRKLSPQRRAFFEIPKFKCNNSLAPLLLKQRGSISLESGGDVVQHSSYDPGGHLAGKVTPRQIQGVHRQIWFCGYTIHMVIELITGDMTIHPRLWLQIEMILLRLNLELLVPCYRGFEEELWSTSHTLEEHTCGKHRETAWLTQHTFRCPNKSFCWFCSRHSSNHSSRRKLLHLVVNHVTLWPHPTQCTTRSRFRKAQG